MNTQQKFAALLLKFYQASNKNFDEFDAEIYFGGVEDVGFDKALEALMQIARSKGFHKIPTVAEIREGAGVIEPEKRDESDAMAGRIIESISRFGGYQAVKAKEFLGDLAWTAIERVGGWNALCLTELDQLPTLRAQLRGMCQSVRAMDSVGRLHEPLPGLNSSNIEQVNKMLALMGAGRKPDLEPLN